MTFLFVHTNPRTETATCCTTVVHPSTQAILGDVVADDLWDMTFYLFTQIPERKAQPAVRQSYTPPPRQSLGTS